MGKHTRIKARRERIYVVRRAVVGVCALLCCILAVLSTIGAERSWPESDTSTSAAATAAVKSGTLSKTASELKRDQVPESDQANQAQSDNSAQQTRWMDATGDQPNLSQYSDLSVDVDIAAQKVYVKSGGQTIYTMITSTGVDDATPRGSYTIDDRGDHFYNAAESMGADYWVRFDGPFLFHSVPTGENFGDYLEEEGAKLGQPASHGCVRLTVADAKWFYEQIPIGTPVTIA